MTMFFLHPHGLFSVPLARESTGTNTIDPVLSWHMDSEPHLDKFKGTELLDELARRVGDRQGEVKWQDFAARMQAICMDYGL